MKRSVHDSDIRYSAIERSNRTEHNIDFVPVSEQIHEHALKTPYKTAVICGDRVLSYSQMDRMSNIVANFLLKKIKSPDSLIGVLMERSELVYIAEQGILKAHAAFLPFTTTCPDERIIFSMKDSSSHVILTNRRIITERSSLSGKDFELISIEDILKAGSDSKYPSSEGISPSDLAYCIYTSGSTGRPKGVMIEQGNLSNYVNKNEKSTEITYYASPGRIALAMASFSFDVSIVEQFVPLCNGATVSLATEKEIHDPLLLAENITSNNVNGITCTPTYLNNIVNIPECEKALRQIDFFDVGSEAFPKNLFGRLRTIRSDSVILNVYGPTECTMGCAAGVIEDDDDITIGTPMANTRFYIMDKDGQILPPGEKGELIICGAGVGRGYVNLQDLTSEAFFIYDGMRAYHSGDLASWTEDGRICILGRIDNQVKLRGFRIELEEIERVICKYKGITGCVVRLWHDASDFLAAYITSPDKVDTDGLRSFIAENLPQYMIPAVIMQLDSFPETVNGKADKNALPKPHFNNAGSIVRPRNKTEKWLLDVYSEVLHTAVDKISITDDFFEIGGDSLKSMLLASRLKYRGISSSEIYNFRSIERLADYIATHQQVEPLDEIELCERKKSHRLSAMQTKMVDYQFAKTKSTMWNNMYYLFRFNKKTDPEKLRLAVNKAIQHHPAFSMVIGFDEYGEMVQRYVPDLFSEFQYEKTTDLDLILHKDELVKPFKMFNSPLLRVRMFLTESYSYLFFDVHHLAMDGACIGIIMSSIVLAYQGKPLQPDYYCSYLAGEDSLCDSIKYLEDKAYFEEKYGGYDWCCIPEPDRDESTPRPAGRVVRFPFDASDLENAEQRLNTTRSVIAIAAAIKTLHEATGKNDIMTNWIFNNRLGSFASASVGMMIKNLPVGIHMDQIHNIPELLLEVKKQVAEGITHSSYDYFSSNDSAFHNDPMEVNYQKNMNADELEILHPFSIDLNNKYRAPGARLELEFLENDDSSGRFDSEIEWAANCFSDEKIISFHNLYIENFERIVLG